MSDKQDNENLLNPFIGQPLIGITIEEEIVTFSFANGFIEVSGEDFELYIERLPLSN
jgi:hypothetical protein